MIETLKAYQAWRRGDDERTLEATGLTPAIIGEAIDWAIGVDEERYGLMAQLDTLQKAIYRQQRKEGWYEEHPLVTLCIATPEHCLAEIKAKATKDGFFEALLVYTDEPKDWCMDKAEQNQKISEILRRQSKENNP